MTRIAFVTPWYGRDVPGGAESETRRTAGKLWEAGFPIEILTMCVRDLYSDWGSNFHQPGVTEEDGIVVHRFPVQDRDRQAFDHVNWRLMNGLSITEQQEQIYISEMMRVPRLYEYMASHAEDYLYVFIPYMFATTYHGAKICPQRSLMIPCLHDEAYARLTIFREVLPRVRAVIFHTEAERRLWESLFGPSTTQIREIIGEGVDTDFYPQADRFRNKFGLKSPLILYAGRREPGKNTPLLIDFWRRYKYKGGNEAALVLIGPGDVSIPEPAASGIVDLGFVPLQDKYDAMAAADVFCLPSVNESFSLVTMESWLARTPVLVNGHCDVTREHCQRSNGGLYFTNYDEFAAALDILIDRPELACQLGRQGRRYVLRNYQWPTIVDKYRQLIDRVLNQ